jgi:hypothetical protein
VERLQPLALAAGLGTVSEAEIQALVQHHPSCLPISEIDPLFADPVPICTELNTPAGPIDNLMVTPSGLPVLVECKLWRNPEGRREVVGQILDYAKELTRWSSSDLQREVNRRTGSVGNSVLDRVRAAGHDVEEIGFNDALTLNLRRGRFLLIIVGDGIREGVEAIAEYLQAHAGLHFTLGLIEMPIYVAAGGDRLIVPRVLARTQLITRTVVLSPSGSTVLDEAQSPDQTPETAPDEATTKRVEFLQAVVSGLSLDDPEQAPPRVTPKGYCYVYLPAPASSCWIALTVKPGAAGLYVTSNTNTLGEQALQEIGRNWDDIRELLGGEVQLRYVNDRRPVFEEYYPFGAVEETQAIEWLRSRLNDFVNVFRPRVKAIVQDLTATAENRLA